jgi:hypothetical protein
MAQLEEEALRFAQREGQYALQRALLVWVKGIPWPSEVPDEEGGEPYRLVRWPRLDLNTVVGMIQITVPSYEKTGKESLRPVEAALGIRGSISPLLQRLCASIGVELPFVPSERELSELSHVDTSYQTIRRICGELGEVAREEQKTAELPSGFGQITQVTVQQDGGRVNTDEGWREPRLARIEAINEAGKSAVFLLTAIVSAQDFWALVSGLLSRLRLDACRNLAFIGDGAKWILMEAARRYPHASCILDFYHAAEHIHDAAKLIFGEGTAQAEAWARRYRRLLRKGRAQYVLQCWRLSLKHLGARGSKAHEALAGLIEYFDARREQLRYPAFRRRKLPIGSGKIEALVKQVLNLRLKRNGAWWTLANAERMLALRAAKLFGRLDEVWEARISDRMLDVPSVFVDLLGRTPGPILHPAPPNWDNSHAA